MPSHKSGLAVLPHRAPEGRLLGSLDHEKTGRLGAEIREFLGDAAAPRAARRRLPAAKARRASSRKAAKRRPAKR